MKKLLFSLIIALVTIGLAMSSCKKEKEEVNLLLGQWVLMELYDDNGDIVKMTDSNGLTRKVTFKFNACEEEMDVCELNEIITFTSNGQPVNYQTANDYDYSYVNNTTELTIMDKVYIIDILTDKDLHFHLQNNPLRKFVLYKL